MSTNKSNDSLKSLFQSLRKGVVNDLIEYIDQTCAKKSDIEELKGLINHLPTTEDFYKKEDEIVGELEKAREEQILLSQHVSDLSDRMDEFEKN